MGIFLDASADLFNGKNIYKITYKEWYHYYYDALFATFLYPLTFLNIYWATFLWLAMNLLFSYRIWSILSSYLELEKILLPQRVLITTISLFFIYGLWYKNIHVSQMTIFILYISLEGIHLIEKGKLFWGGLFIGLGISIKLLPLVLLPYLLYRGQFKALLYVLLSILLILGIPVFYLGSDHYILLLQERWLLINPLNTAHVLDVEEESFHSLTTLLSTLLVDNVGNVHALDWKRNIAEVSLSTLHLIIQIVRLFFVSLTFLFLQPRAFKRSQSMLQSLYELSYIFLITPLIFPHQQHYAFFFVFPALAYLCYFHVLRFSKEREKTISQKIGWIVVFIGLYLLLNSHFLLGSFRPIFDHYKTLTYGVLLLIPLLAFSRPTKLENLKASERI